jgi:hypothetical protein
LDPAHPGELDAARGKDLQIIAENEELCRIIAASIKDAGGFERA